MNQPPHEFERIAADRLRRFVSACLRAAGLRSDHGEQLAQLLTNSDLRGVRSHGSRQVPGYCMGLRDGMINPDPRLSVARETATAVLVDGDGGFGYAPMMEATERALPKARDQGIAIAAARHLGHYGSAGHYVRRAVADGFAAYSVQGHALRFDRSGAGEKRSAGYWGNPPFCFGLPAGDEPPVVVDGGTVLMADCTDPILQELVPAAFFKSMGLTAVSMALGGGLVGTSGSGAQEVAGKWPAAGMGGMIVIIDIGLFAPQAEFRSSVDAMVRGVRETMAPVKGFEEALLPGTVEWRKEREYGRDGIPVGPEDLERLNELAAALGVDPLQG